MGKRYDDKNRGALFPNNRKSGKKSPDRTGKIQVGAFPDIGISAWNRKDDDTGEHFLSVSINDWKGNSETRGDGVLRQNKNAGNGQQPDLVGDIEWTGGKWEGETWGIAAWKRESREGKPFLSIKLDPPEQSDQSPPLRQAETRRQPEPEPSRYEADDDIPF